MELTENDQLKRIITKLSNEIANTKVHAAASESLAEMLREKVAELEAQVADLEDPKATNVPEKSHK